MGSDSSIWSKLLPKDPITLNGRVPEDRSTKYLATTSLTANKDLVIVALTPTSTESIPLQASKDAFEKLFTFHLERK